MKPLIYIAGPYTNPDPISNTRRAIEVGMSLYDTGLCAVLIPHMTMLADFISPRSVEEWYQFDLDQLSRCQGVYRLVGESTGADRECDHAFVMNISVKYERRTYGHFLTTWLTELGRVYP